MDGEKQLVSCDPEVVSGALVFAGTRVPVQVLVDYLAAADSLGDSLEGSPGVTREQAEGYLQMALEAVVENMGAGAFR